MEGRWEGESAPLQNDGFRYFFLSSQHNITTNVSDLFLSGKLHLLIMLLDFQFKYLKFNFLYLIDTLSDKAAIFENDITVLLSPNFIFNLIVKISTLQ